MINLFQNFLNSPVGAWGALFLFVSLCLLICLLLVLLRFRAGSSNKELEQSILTFTKEQQMLLQNALGQHGSQLRIELDAKLSHLGKDQQERLLGFARLVQQMNEQSVKLQSSNRLEANQQLNLMTQSIAQELSGIRTTLNSQLQTLQVNNERKLEQMRNTVEEKLQSTLETRLSESFQQVANQLREVESGLGEMRTLAGQVGELKRVLTNVKSRGTFGEVQLKSILDEIIPNRYEENIATIPGSLERVEFAVRMPGLSLEETVLLPIDAKFPVEDYLKIEEAREKGTTEDIEKYSKALDIRLKSEAKKIHEKYVRVPYTTEFAILFLPSESLYAECLRRVGTIEELQQKYRITVAGPTVLSALLNSLQMGFKTLAIQERSAEVWAILGNVKTEFNKFAQTLETMDKNVDTMKNTISRVKTRTHAMGRQLKNVQELPGSRNSDTLTELSTGD